MYLILVAAIIIGGYFAFRYLLLLNAVGELCKELCEIKEDITQNHILHLPNPNRHLGKLIGLINDTLEEIRSERVKYAKSEKALQKEIENISHDLRTPLTVILGYLKLLKKSTEGEKPLNREEMKESLCIIEKKAESLKHLVTQFYDYSRFSSDDYRLELERIDISRSLRETLTGNYRFLEGADLEVEVKIPEYPLWVLGEKTAMERIFANLLQNAGRYASGYLHISVSEEEHGIAVLFVNDTVTLIEEDIPRLFQRFYRQDGSRSQEGTGLGLTVAKALAEEMQGTLEACLQGSHKRSICFKLCLKRV